MPNAERLTLWRESPKRPAPEKLPSSLVVTVAARCFKKEFLYEFFREAMAMPHEASIVQDWINQGIERGFERGMEKGLETGLKKGLEEGQRAGELRAIRADILDVLTERFGAGKKVAEMGKTLETIDNSTILRSLLKESVKVTSLDEFQKTAEKLAKD